MDDKKTGGAAFPDPGRAQSAKQREVLTETGMTLRDYFAIRVMAALAVLPRSSFADGPLPGENGNCMLARLAYVLADALLLERAK